MSATLPYSPNQNESVERFNRTTVEKVRSALDSAGLKPELAEVTMKPLAETVLTGDEAERMQKLLDILEDLDDVQQVYTTAALVQ